MTQNLFEQAEDLPEAEGIFYFYDNKLLSYICVAENLRKEFDGILLEVKTFSDDSAFNEMKFARASNQDLIKIFTETIKRKRPRRNLSISEQKLYPHLKITGEDFPRLLVTRKIENDSAEYFGAFLPETGVRFLLDFLNRTFRLRNCTIPIDGSFPVACTQFYEKLCVAPCVENICGKSVYIEFVHLTRLFLRDKKEELDSFLREKIAVAAEVLDFETAKFWRDILLKTQESWKEKKLQLRLDDTIDTFEIKKVAAKFFIYLITQRGRKILGKRVFVFEKKENFPLGNLLSQFLWQFYQFHNPKEIRVSHDFHNRKFLSRLLTCRAARKIDINVIKSASRKISTQRAVGRAKFEFNFRQIKPPLNEKDLQNEISKEFNLKIRPKRIECFDVAHISGTNFVAAKAVWAKGEFLTNEYQFWSLAETGELKALEKGIEESFDKAENLPDLVLIDGGKAQLKAALNALEKFGKRNFPLLSAVKPPRRHNEISHFLDEKSKTFVMKPESDAMQLLVRLRDEAHGLANHIHQTLRDNAHFYAMASVLPDLDENLRKSLIQKFGSVNQLKLVARKRLVELFGNKLGEKIFVSVNNIDFNKVDLIKPLIVPIRYDDANGQARDLLPLRLRAGKKL